MTLAAAAYRLMPRFQGFHLDSLEGELVRFRFLRALRKADPKRPAVVSSGDSCQRPPGAPDRFELAIDRCACIAVACDRAVGRRR